MEFGYKAQVTDNDDGVVLDYRVEYGAAPDAPLLAPAVERIHRRTGRVPRAVTADRGYGQPAVERDLQELGVRTVAIPRQAKISPARKATEHSRGFRRLVKWRTGSEGRISYLKRSYGWDRTRLDGRQGAAIWCGHGVFRPQPGQNRGRGQLTPRRPALWAAAPPRPNSGSGLSGRSSYGVP